MPRKKSLTYYKNKAWRVFSKYIRTRDCLATTDFPDQGKCVTCGKYFPFSELQAGHAIGGRSNSILFDEKLVSAQCRACNHYGNGRYGEYSVWFIKKYGLKEWEAKVKLSRTLVKYTQQDYKDIHDKYKAKLDRLLK